MFSIFFTYVRLPTCSRDAHEHFLAFTINSLCFVDVDFRWDTRQSHFVVFTFVLHDPHNLVHESTPNIESTNISMLRMIRVTDKSPIYTNKASMLPTNHKTTLTSAFRVHL